MNPKLAAEMIDGTFDHPILTRYQERNLLKLSVKGDEIARNELIRCNQRLIGSIAARFVNPSSAYPDLVAEGNRGLFHALRKFRLSKGVRLGTYAVPWIKRYMQAYVLENRTIRIPINQAQLAYKTSCHFDDLNSELGRDPTPEELGKSIKEEPFIAQRALQDSRVVAFSIPDEDEDKDNAFDTVTFDSEEASVPDIVINKDNIAKLKRCLKRLPARQQEIIRRRFAIGKYKKKEIFDAIGKDMDLCRERIRQLEVEALNSLRKMIQNDRTLIDPYVAPKRRKSNDNRVRKNVRKAKEAS